MKLVLWTLCHGFMLYKGSHHLLPLLFSISVGFMDKNKNNDNGNNNINREQDVCHTSVLGEHPAHTTWGAINYLASIRTPCHAIDSSVQRDDPLCLNDLAVGLVIACTYDRIVSLAHSSHVDAHFAPCDTLCPSPSLRTSFEAARPGLVGAVAQFAPFRRIAGEHAQNQLQQAPCWFAQRA